MIAMLLFLVASLAFGHDLKPGAIALQETSPNTFAMRLSAAADGGGVPVPVRPRWPDGCSPTLEGLHCVDGLAGRLEVPGLALRQVKVVVHVQWADGAVVQAVLREGEDAVWIDRHGSGKVAPGDYLGLGLEHVLSGVDHLAFVLALGLLVGVSKRLVWAITAFTAGHSVTLAAAALGVGSAPGPAVELVIALSVLLLAREAAVGQEGWTARYPAVVAGGFGLIHGLGFAGALGELGLPPGGRVHALLGFNIGVEIGQLAVLGAGALVAAGARRLVASPDRLRRLAAYGVGLPAGVWTVERLVAWWG